MSPNPKDPSLLFDEALAGHQEDFVKITGKYRKNYHHLSADEIISEVNLALLKKKEELLISWGNEFCATKFQQMAYVFTRNIINWTHSRLNRNSYIAKRNDAVFETEEGSITSFDIACDKAMINEEPEALSRDSNTKCSYILKMIKDYCFILTEQEMKALTLKEEGLNLREIAQKLGVSHQAVSCIESSISDKVKSHLNIDPFRDNSFSKIPEGNKCLKEFFTSYAKFSSQDKSDLIDLIKSSIGQLTGKEISGVFKGGKFTSKQIYSFCAKNGLSPFLKKISNKVYDPDQESVIIQMVSKGSTVEQITAALGRDSRSISSKLRSLKVEGRISKYPPRSKDSLSREDQKLLSLFKDGYSSREIALRLGESNPRSISAKKGNFTKKGLLPNASVGRA